MQIEQWQTSRPVPYIRNPRKNDLAVAKVKASLKEFGFKQPIVVDQDGVIVVGHTRHKAAIELGLETVPVLVAADLTPAQIKAYRIADNRTNEEAEWDSDLLAIELDDLKVADFDTLLTGFDPDEINKLTLGGVTDGLTDDDAAPALPDQPKTIPGDIWVLGNHRLVCGSATAPNDVMLLLEGKHADMVFTDPPYGVSFQSGMSQGGTATRFDKLQNDDQILDVFPVVNEFLRNDGAAFVWTSHQVYPVWRAQFASIYKGTIIWHKPGGGIGDLKGNYATDYEMALFCVKGRVHFRGKRGMAVWRISKDAVSSYVHPTQKPVELAVTAIQDFTDPGYTVLDLFGGSGSTLIACEKTNRHCRMMELDPKYCDVIIRRWQQFTGKKAIHEDGTPFDERL